MARHIDALTAATLNPQAAMRFANARRDMRRLR